MSNNPATRVAEIFGAAGQAFNTLGELTGQLQASSTSSSASGQSATHGGVSVKWNDEEMQLLHAAVTNFANDLHTISERVKGKTVSSRNDYDQRSEF